MLVILQRCTLGGREEYMMQGCLLIHLCTREVKIAYFPDWKETINIPLLVLGDPAYPLLSWLMIAFTDNGSLSCQQKTFNYRLSRAWVVVEHAYGRLKGWWRTLRKRNSTSVHGLPKLVAACCVLHNVKSIERISMKSGWMVSQTMCQYSQLQ